MTVTQLNTEGLHPQQYHTAAAMPAVAGRCPACGSRSLFLAPGGHVTCAIIDCPDPTAVADMLNPGASDDGEGGGR